jgi:hypothetical protein
VKRDRPSNTGDQGVILRFRRRKPSGQGAKQAHDARNSDIGQLLELSKYEKRAGPDDFKGRMTENIAAAILLGALVTIAVVDVVSLEQVQQCPPGQHCVH